MLQHEFESRVGIEVSAQEYISINAVYECSDFTVYFVLRNTGSAIVRTFTDALAEKNSFGNKNATTIYTVHVNRTMNIGSIVIANGNNTDKVIF